MNQQNKPKPPTQIEEATQQQLTLQQVTVLQKTTKKKKRGKKRKRNKDNKVEEVATSKKKRKTAPKQAKQKSTKIDETNSDFEEEKNPKTKTNKKSDKRGRPVGNIKKVMTTQDNEDEEGIGRQKKQRQGKTTKGIEMIIVSASSINGSNQFFPRGDDRVHQSTRRFIQK